MSFRSDVVNEAIREWERYPKGRPDLYADEVGGARGAEWCGYFVLRSLQRAGLAKGVRWIQSKGFIDPLNLPITRSPLPGDVAYVAEPFQHEAVVVSYDPITGMLTTMDGNQPAIKPKVRFVQNGGIMFYSIQPLVDEAERNQSFLGIMIAGAAIVGAAAWAWENGLPGPIERGLKRLGI